MLTDRRTADISTHFLMLFRRNDQKMPELEIDRPTDPLEADLDGEHNLWRHRCPDASYQI